MGFPRPKSWSGLPFPPPGDLPDPGMEPAPFVSPALTGGFFTTVPPGVPTQLHHVTPPAAVRESSGVHTLTNICL